MRNRRFMQLNPRYRVEEESVSESAMVTSEIRITGDSGLQAQRLARIAQTAFSRTKSTVSGILKGSLTLLSRAAPETPTARWPGEARRRTVTWGQSVPQSN